MYIVVCVQYVGKLQALSISNLPEMQKVRNTHQSWSTCDFEQLCPATDLVQNAQLSNSES